MRDKKLNLNNVTLVCVSTTSSLAAIKALRYSKMRINFNRVLLINSETDENEKDIECIKIAPFADVGEWGKFIVFELYKFISTDFIILIHPDGFIVNPYSWKDDWFNYDYIGSPFKIPNDKVTYRDANGKLQRVGNSVSLRSKRLLELPTTLNLRWENFDGGFPHEDGYISVQHRIELENNGMKFADLLTACEFGREANIPEHKGVKPFVFHKWKGRNIIYPCFNRRELMLRTWKKILIKVTRFGKNY